MSKVYLPMEDEAANLVFLAEQVSSTGQRVNDTYLALEKAQAEHAKAQAEMGEVYARWEAAKEKMIKAASDHDRKWDRETSVRPKA